MATNQEFEKKYQSRAPPNSSPGYRHLRDDEKHTRKSTRGFFDQSISRVVRSAQMQPYYWTTQESEERNRGHAKYRSSVMVYLNLRWKKPELPMGVEVWIVTEIGEWREWRKKTKTKQKEAISCQQRKLPSDFFYINSHRLQCYFFMVLTIML